MKLPPKKNAVHRNPWTKEDIRELGRTQKPTPSPAEAFEFLADRPRNLVESLLAFARTQPAQKNNDLDPDRLKEEGQRLAYGLSD